MRGLPTTRDDEEEIIPSCFSAMRYRLASFLPGRGRRHTSTGIQRIPSAPTTPVAVAVSGGPHHHQQQQHHAESRVRSGAPYVPRHAAATFSKTATPRQMREENETLR